MFVKELKDRRRTNAMVVCAFLTKVPLLKGLRDEKRTILRGPAGTIVRRYIARENSARQT